MARCTRRDTTAEPRVEATEHRPVPDRERREHHVHVHECLRQAGVVDCDAVVAGGFVGCAWLVGVGYGDGDGWCRSADADRYGHVLPVPAGGSDRRPVLERWRSGRWPGCARQRFGDVRVDREHDGDREVLLAGEYSGDAVYNPGPRTRTRHGVLHDGEAAVDTTTTSTPTGGGVFRGRRSPTRRRWPVVRVSRPRPAR